jgi:hypothetical protein
VVIDVEWRDHTFHHTMIDSTKYAPALRGRGHHGELGFAAMSDGRRSRESD